ncbi:MAG: ribbon-helix-helix protein, CopG family [Candidatus Hadarchaeia archaeon]
MSEKKTTSIKVDPELWKEAKKLAIDRGTTIGALVEDLLRQEVEKNKD